jgi:predicted transposase YbfD/YdcC
LPPKSTMSIHLPLEIALGKLKEHFSSVPDPRINRNKVHPLENVLVIAFAAILCGADKFTEMHEFGKLRRAFFERFLDLSAGVPSHDVFNDVFSAIDIEAFGSFFVEWVRACFVIPEGSTINIDGKTARGSKSKSNGVRAVHLVSAYASEAGISFAQTKVDGKKKNEITAIPHLLDQICLDKAVVTIDAMGCQVEIARKIVEGGGDYVLAVKLNQEALHGEVSHLFTAMDAADTFTTVGKDHGRIETRVAKTITNLDWMDHERERWPGLKTIVKIESTREIGNNVQTEERYYISSMEASAQEHLRRIRSHWGIEASLHYCLDVAFGEDARQVRNHNAVSNLAILLKMAFNILKQDKSTKLGIATKRKKAGWDESYLAHLLICSLCTN